MTRVIKLQTSGYRTPHQRVGGAVGGTATAFSQVKAGVALAGDAIGPQPAVVANTNFAPETGLDVFRQLTVVECSGRVSASRTKLVRVLERFNIDDQQAQLSFAGLTRLSG